uniref:CCHC-type domain-containing protein n=1 Tax=Tanacetum cinerariifolium TaxID=118510 RepID=A0A6L2L075_TANCI|nr:hypothetical protein [Tanacetum cinerariifolium]
MAEDDNILNDGDHPETSNTSPPVPPPTQQIPHTNRNDLVSVTTDTNGIIKVLPPKTAEEVVARKKERKARATLLMALPEDHLAKFHKMADAKEMWEAIKSRFGGNDESKKMQKYLLKQQFDEIHGAGVSHEDANQKFLRSLPSSWSQVALIMRTKPGLDTLSFYDLYNNLRVFKRDVKGTTASSSNIHNVAFVSAKNTSNTNDVSTAYSVSSPSVSKSQKEGSSSYTDEVIHSFFKNQSSAPQLDYNDLEQINDDDIEEMDLIWQVAMIFIRIKKFHKRTGRKLQLDTKDPAGFDKTTVECFNCHEMGNSARDCRAKGNQDSRRRDVRYNGNKTRDNGRRPAHQDDSKALVTIDGEDNDWSGHVKKDAQNYAMIAYSSSNSSSDNEVKSCSKACKESYTRLKKLYDDQRDKLGDASIEITAYTLALKKVEAQLLCHQQNQLAYEQKISKLFNTQMSANDKFGLGYGDYRYGSILSYENEVLQSVFINKASDLEDTLVNDRFADGMHVVPPPMTGKYMLSGPDVEIDYFKFTYGPKQTSANESDFKPSEYASCESDSSIETSTSMLEPEYESDSHNDSVSNIQEDKEKPSFAFTDSVKHVKTSRENIKETSTTNHSPKIEKHDRNGHTRKGLGYDFTRKACFVCGSFSHLIRDCDFHEKRMAKQSELTKSKNKVTGQRENRPVWNNVHRVNHQNKFVPSVLLTKTGKFPVNAARQNYSSHATSTSTASKVNTTRPFIYETRPKRNFYKTHSPNKSLYHDTTAQRTTFSYQKVNVVGNKSLSIVEGNGDTAVKASAGNKAHLANYQEFKGVSVAFGGSNRRITGKGKIKTGSKELASLKQTALGKDISNPLMAGRLSKTTLPTSSVKYALTASPTIRISCIKQFWTTTKVKTINDEVRIQALIDEKRVNIKESSIRRTLKLDDAEGTSCLANAEIFDGLTKMGYEKLSEKLTFYKDFFSPQWKFLIHTILQCLSAKTTFWNKFSSTMASAIICLATNQKFNFSRYILLSLVKNIEVGVPFFMFPRFVQFLIDHQLGDMSHHKDMYDNPSLTKKVFANIKRVGTGFSRVVTLLFDNMLVPVAKEQTQAPKVPSPEPLPEHMLPLPSNDPLPGGKDSLKLKELMYLCTHLSNKVLELESEVIGIKSTYKERIAKLKGRVDRLEEENRGRIIADIDEDVEINLEEAQAKLYKMDLKHIEKVLSMQNVDDEEHGEIEKVLEVVTAAKLITEVVTTAEATKISVPRRRMGIEQDGAFARQLEAELNANINWNAVIEQFKRSERLNDAVMKYQALKRKPLTEAQARKNMIIYLKNMAGYKMNYFKVMTYSEIRPLFEKHYNYNQAFLEEVNEDAIVPEKEVKVEGHKREEATPLASKIPIADYKIHLERNKPYFKIIRADGNHMLFLSFSTLLKNFDKEDLESLWKLVKERFEKTEPKNYTDDYLLKTLKTMFEQSDVEASVWRDQKGRYGLAKRYYLTHFTLEQMLNNVRLEVEEESEMSLELLSVGLDLSKLANRLRKIYSKGLTLRLLPKACPMAKPSLSEWKD